MNTLIIGASNNPERYAYLAMHDLKNAGHKVFLINPTLESIEGEKVYSEITAVDEKIDTVTVYVNSKRLDTMKNDIVKLQPRRIIFNPGTESDALEEFFREAKIEVTIGCTLIMLRCNTF